MVDIIGAANSLEGNASCMFSGCYRATLYCSIHLNHTDAIYVCSLHSCMK